MNCKPGDLAIVIRSEDERNIGLIVTVISAHLTIPGYWYVNDSGRGFAVNRDGAPAGTEGRKVRVLDRDLRPIRGPGDDARDEMLRPLPEEVAA